MELAARRHDVLILSSEAISGIVFYHYRLKLVEHFRQRGYAIHLVLYLRDSPEFLNAAYQQNTRMMREARSFHDYVAFTALGSGGPRPVLRLTGRLDDRLRAAGRLHFRPYDAALREKGIEQDFVDLLNTVCRDEGTATADAPLSVRDVATPRRLNEGCGPLQIEVSRRIAAALLERYPRRLLVQASHGQSHADQVARGIRRAGIREPSYWGFGPELYHRVREALAEENERFAQAVWERSWDAIFPPRPDERLVSNDLVDAGTDEMRALADRLHARIAPSIEAKVARRVARLKPSER
ncbi:MAG: hypothetical protein D6754_06585 [Alphaproteobacteria bacterium]|nr:MAG: hypothetical protein D6754_06585 [Alphaproteobacteria bacterium]